MKRLRMDGRPVRTRRLLCEYTFCFAVFFIAVFSPFWLYGRSMLWGSDGSAQYIPELIFTRHWARTILDGLRQGRLEIPFWSLSIGLGQGVLGNVVTFKLLNFLYCLFPYNALEQYLVVRLVIGMYISGLSFLAYGRTRTANRTYLVLGSMLYLFSGFIPFYVTRHWLFLEMTFAFPLMLLGVDQIFDGKWSWLFIATVFLIAMSYFYTLYMVTLPAVIYAFFHFFELDREARRARGGFFRILLRHVIQYAVGLGLAAVSLLPSMSNVLEGCRNAAQQGVNLFWWKPLSYFGYISGIVDSNTVIDNGYIALPSVALAAIVTLFATKRKKDKALVGQILLYNLAFWIPVLDMLFSAFAGKTMRWSYALTFWVGICTACMLPRLRKQGKRLFKYFACAMSVYLLAYLFVNVWNGDGNSVSVVLAVVGFCALYAATASDWGKRRKRLATLLLFVVLLAELTAKSYERFSPQYRNHISKYANAGDVLARTLDSGADLLEPAADGEVYRVDLAMDDPSLRSRMSNYGSRDMIYGVSNYYNLSNERTVRWAESLGTAHMKFRFLINDLDQRTALDALAGVEYVAVLEEGENRVPYGYELVKSGEKRLSDGTTTGESLYRNKYALPLAYAYESCVSLEAYNALLPNQREQAMLQGVVLEDEAPLPEAELTFDDRVLLDKAGIYKALEKIADKDESLVVDDGVLRVKKANYTVTIPMEQVEGEVYLQFTGMHFKSVNYSWEEARNRAEAGDTRLRIMASRRKARQWQPADSSLITVTCGKRNDEVTLLAEDHQYYFGKRDVLLNLGYGEYTKDLKIKFAEAGEYTFDDASIICQPMDGYAEKIAPLQENGAVSTRVDGNRVTLEFDLERDAMACLSIPWSSGWSARVDGEPAEIVPANVAFMGVMLPKGAHTVEFSYMPRGLRLGAVISLATLLALACGGLFVKLRRRRSKPGAIE